MTVRKIFARHFDKAFLGSALAAFLTYGLATGLAARQDDLAPAVQACADRVFEESRKDHTRFQAPSFPISANGTGEVNRLHESAILKAWEHLPSLTSVGVSVDWVSSLLPMGVERIQRFEKPTVTPVLMATVDLKSVDARLEGVVLTWSILEPKGEGHVAAVDSLLLERTHLGTNVTESSLVKDPKAGLAVDKGTARSARYRYRIVPVTTDARYREQRPTGKGEPSNAFEVTAVGTWRLHILNVSPPTGEVPGNVFVRIEVFDEVAGRVSKDVIHREGDRIGRWSEGPNLEPTNRHAVSVQGKSFQVDFDTRCVLRTIRESNVIVTRKKCTKRFGPAGQLPCPGPVLEEHSIPCREVRYGESDGSEQVVRIPDPANDPRAKDDLCPAHRAARK